MQNAEIEREEVNLLESGEAEEAKEKPKKWSDLLAQGKKPVSKQKSDNVDMLLEGDP